MNQKISVNDWIKQKPGVLTKELDGQTVILDSRSGEIRTLNEAAGTIWNLAKKKITVGEMAEEVTRHYEVDHLSALEDVKDFVSEYLRKKLLLIYHHNLKK